MNKRIQVTSPSMPPFEEYTAEIRDLWDSGWLTHNGPKHNLLMQQLCEYLNVPNTTLFANGHLALETAIEALALTGEVITTPYTFASTTHAIVRKGLTPKFCDIDPETFNINADCIESLITEKTSVIVPVHVYGKPCDTEKIADIAKRYGLKVIYDAAHAFGVKVGERGIGDYGDISMFSFHATKVFNTVEGGALTYSDSSLSPQLDQLKQFGLAGREDATVAGTNAKMTEVNAAMGLCNLRHIDEEIEKRRTVVQRYFERLQGVAGIKLPEYKPNIKHNYAYFAVVFDGYKKNRDEIFALLKEDNIFARKYFYPLTNNFECYQGRFNPELTPVAKYIADRVLTLPLYANLELDDVDRICSIILN